MEADFTKGPWVVGMPEGPSGIKYPVVVDARSTQIALVNDQKWSNACLIAAAPRMYNCLMRVLEDFNKDMTIYTADTIQEIIATLKEARGEQ
jgi:hypothetical protein